MTMKGITLPIICIVLCMLFVKNIDGKKESGGKSRSRSSNSRSSNSRSSKKNPACMSSKTMKDFKIPEPMPKSTFEQNLGDYKSQFLFGTSSEIQTTIAENVEVKFEKINATDYKHFKRGHAEGSGDCIMFSHDLRLLGDGTKAKFARIGQDIYMLAMFFFDWVPGQVTCPRDKVWVYLMMAKLGRPTNVNLLSAFNDIKDDVDIEFGDGNLLWKIDFGEYTACA